jgi:hypothetical protein
VTDLVKAQPLDLSVAPAVELERVFLEAPQLPAPVLHHFAPGIYTRELHMPADSVAVGRSHKKPCLNVLLKGALSLRRDDGSWSTIEAPSMWVGSAGSKVAVVIKDTVFLNQWATTLRDVAEIEREVLDDSEAFLAALEAQVDAARAQHVDDVADFNALDGCDLVVADGLDPFPYGTGSKVAVWPSPIHGVGLFASANVDAGEVIGPLVGDAGGLTPAVSRVNHSTRPNAAFVGGFLVALCKIPGCVGGNHGTEICVDYRDAARVIRGEL